MKAMALAWVCLLNLEGPDAGGIIDGTRVVRANITLERGVLKAIDAATRRRKLTRSAFLAQAASYEIER